MELNYNCTGDDRKRLAKAISEITGAPAQYLYAPSFAYQVDYFTIDRNGSVSFDDRADSEEIENLIGQLAALGFMAESKETEETAAVEPQSAEVDGLCISMPVSLFSETALQNLKNIIAAKGTLIRKALGVDDLPIEVTDTKVSFPWFAGLPSPDEIKAYDHFICALCEMARNQKSITAKERVTNNDRYGFR